MSSQQTAGHTPAPSVFARVTGLVLAELGKGTAPWRKPWRVDFGLPRNLASGKSYRGVNILTLMTTALAVPYPHNLWLTFNQAKERGGHVNQGEHGVPILFYKKALLDADGEVLDEAEAGANTVGLKWRPILKVYTVFNATQCTGIELPTSAPQAPLDPDAVVSARLNPTSRHENGFWTMFGIPDNPQWQADKERGLFTGKLMWELGKVGIDSPAGWAAFSNGAGYAFIAEAAVVPGAEYPDQGSSVEFFTVGRGRVGNLSWDDTQVYLMEVELLSPLRRMAPGESTAHHLEWKAARCLGPIVDVTEAGVVGKALQVKRQGDYVALNGTFGVFEPGHLFLESRDALGQGMGREELGPVGPLGVINLEQMCRAPAAAANAVLVLRAGDERRTLASATL